MVRFLQIVAAGCLIALITGCNGSGKDKPIWEDTKLRDLAPAHITEQSRSELLKTINICVYTFKILAEDIGELDEVWEMLEVKPVRFNDYDAFGANSFSAGFGPVQVLDKVGALLHEAGDKTTIETVSLLLLDGQADDVPISKFGGRQDISYVSTGGSTVSERFGPGALALRIQVERIPGSRGVCNLRAMPVFSLSTRATFRQLADRAKLGRYFFNCCGFEFKASPGDFVLLGPKEYLSDQVTLGSLFFSIPKRKPVVRVYLIVCTAINI